MDRGFGLVRALGIAAIATGLAGVGAPAAQPSADRPAGARQGEFLLVMPRADGPFYGDVASGCEAAAERLSADCRVIVSDRRDQSRDPTPDLEARLDPPPRGLAIVGGHPRLAETIVRASNRGIPIVTIDRELAGTPRSAFLGINNKDFGRALARAVLRFKPTGGRFAVITGDPEEPVLIDRLAGLRRLLGAEWTEAEGSPVATAADFAAAADAVDRMARQEPAPDAIVALGAWPMLASEKWRELTTRLKARLDSGEIILVVADALPAQRELLAEGRVHALVGARARDLGERAVETLARIGAGRATPEVIFVGFDVIVRPSVAGSD